MGKTIMVWCLHSYGQVFILPFAGSKTRKHKYQTEMEFLAEKALHFILPHYYRFGQVSQLQPRYVHNFLERKKKCIELFCKTIILAIIQPSEERLLIFTANRQFLSFSMPNCQIWANMDS